MRAAALTLGFLLCAPAARAVDKEIVNRAIDKGVAALKALQGRDGVWAHHEIGATALAGLTLLECKVAKDDPAVEAAANAVRQSSVRITSTYSLGLSILFLDRLGDPRDLPFIESLTVRLLAGQSGGCWTYQCPPIADAEVQRLTQLLRQRNELKTAPQPPGKRTVKDLPAEIQQQVAVANRLGGAGGVMGAGDNSNTQFAVLGLWVARRHGLPVDDALIRTDTYFRRSQNQDGGWSYTPMQGGAGAGITSTPAMTCAGLLGLAVSHGVAGDPDRKGPALDPTKDVKLRGGLVLLSTAIGLPGGRNIPRVGAENGGSYYFLWSLERVAMALGLETIGRKDWYSWGAEVIVANQGPDGHWRGSYADGGADTCFALLFLSRSNLAGDLSATLANRVKDPGKVELKSGGVGGDTIRVDKGLRSGLDPAPKGERASSEGKGKKEPGKPIPAAAENPAAEKLSASLVRATPAEQEDVLKKLQETKGVENTEALALAIPRMDGDARRKARQALADRLTRMSPKSLLDYMKDVDPEIRRAAVLASAMRDARENVPGMIERLDDPDPLVVRAARSSLKAISGQDHGPESDGSREEHRKAVDAWKDWWRRQQK